MTRPWRALLLCLTTLLLLGQSVAAPAHCLRLARPAAQGSGFALPLCTPEGLRWVVHAADRPEAPSPDGLTADLLPADAPIAGTALAAAGGDAAPDHAEPGFCPACHGLPDGLALPAGPAPPAPRWALRQAAPPPAPAPFALSPPRGPPGGPRGPPALA
ncbi:hypothetical protein [Pseudoroseomonas cervicalis]|uniref:hypothetical protein n=1 Tax=Teichococcus cervicalis TaxID=204525 RepID=UPI0027862F29|nr:hypothetical protein [Pseudoroseomonas cervicalis]MDQ1080026.1 hypothetical protein [Pseudoroseomonas cervicalis]